MTSEPILVTGASGFLGQEICQALSTDYEIDTLGRSYQNTYRVDLSRQTPTFEKQFNIVIHAAGKAHIIPRTQTEEDEFFQTNFQGTLYLLRGLENSGKLPQAFVFLSTVAVYGREEGEMITETFLLKGKTPYAKSKIQAELYLAQWCERNNVKLTILRLPLLVGANPPGNLGAMIGMMKKGFYVGIGSGAARKSMVLAADVARFIPLVAKLGGTYNLTDGYHPALVDLENAIARNIGQKDFFRLPDSFLRLVARAGDVLGDWSPINSHKFKKLTSTLTFSDAKARVFAGWKPHSVIDHLPKFLIN
jgi:GlcNAc-P-P-Und epimerase